MKHNELHKLLILHSRFSYKHSTAKQIRESKAGVTKNSGGASFPQPMATRRVV